MKSRFAIRTLRNQIMTGFLLVMAVVLAVNSVISYRSSSGLLTEHAERHMRLTAAQANGRMEALINQVNTLTLQIAIDPAVQQVLLKEAAGQPASFQTRQNLGAIVSKAQLFSTDIHALELYTQSYKRMYPLDDRQLDQRLKPEWIAAADVNRGKIAWLGIDPEDGDSVLAVRQIPLIDRWYSNGGYLAVKVRRDYFKFREPVYVNRNESLLFLLDGSGSLIASNLPGGTDPADILAHIQQDALTIDGKEYRAVREQTAVPGWQLVMLTPLHSITDGISVLRSAVLISGAIGFLLFLIMSWFLSTLITQPIRHLMRVMRSVRLGKLKPNPKQYSNREMNELNDTYNRMVREIDQLIQLVYEKEIMQSRTELKALQAQINPHFLFNTLEAFYWSLEEKNEPELARLVIAMSELFRYTISQPQMEEWVTIRDELDHVERYLAIIQMRLGDRITWRIESDPKAEEAIIPKLLIQPIVENAVQHGLENKRGPGSVVVRAVPDASSSAVEISVEDDGFGMAPSVLERVRNRIGSGKLPSDKGAGMAIANVYRRLQLFYADTAFDFGFTIDSSPESGTKVRFAIPWKAGEKAGA